MAALFDMRSTDSGSQGDQDYRPRNYREMAFKLWPGSPAQLTYMMSKLPSRTTDDPEYKIFEWRLPQMVWEPTVVSGGGPFTITVAADEAYGLKEGDLLEDEGTDYKYIVSTETANGTTFIVTDYASTGGTPDTDSSLRWVGSVYAEGSQAPTSIMREASLVTNYTQIFKDTVKITGTAANTKHRPFKPWPQAKGEALERHMLKLEHAVLRGKKKEDLTGSEPRRSFGGLNEFITGITDFSTTGISFNDIEDELQNIFKYGSKDKALVCGATQLKILNRVVRNHAALKFNLSDKVPLDQSFGLSVVNWATPFGMLRLMEHKLMTESDFYTKDGYILDMKYLQYVKMAGRDTKWFPNAQLPDEDAKKGYYQTECGLSVALPEVHRRWTGVSQYAADIASV